MDSQKIVKSKIYKFFEIGIFIKGIDGLLEIVGGILLVSISQAAISRIIILFTQHELIEDPKDLIANYLVWLAQNYSLNIAIFASLYLLIHGSIKIFLIICLWKRRLWAYPTAITFFVIFIIYQLYRYSYTHSIWLIFLTIFDVMISILTWIEYNRLKSIQRPEISN